MSTKTSAVVGEISLPKLQGSHAVSDLGFERQPGGEICPGGQDPQRGGQTHRDVRTGRGAAKRTASGYADRRPLAAPVARTAAPSGMWGMPVAAHCVSGAVHKASIIFAGTQRSAAGGTEHSLGAVPPYLVFLWWDGPQPGSRLDASFGLQRKRRSCNMDL